MQIIHLVDSGGMGGIERHIEVLCQAQRAQGLSAVAVEMHSEITASDSAYANLNLACCKKTLWRAANRVAAPTRLARNISTHHHVLTRLESKSLAQSVGHMQGDGLAIQAFSADSHHLQLVKYGNGAHGEFSRA
jgi:hypothetical protein